MMSFMLARSDPIIPHAPPTGPYSMLSPSSATPPSVIPRRPTRSSLRSNKTDSGVASETILEADEQLVPLVSPAQSPPPTVAATSSSSSSFPSFHRPAPSALANHLKQAQPSVQQAQAITPQQHQSAPNTSNPSSNQQQASPLSYRGLDLDHLLGPRRPSISSLSARDDHFKPGHASSPPKPLLSPLHPHPHPGQIFYSSSPTTTWLVSSSQLDPLSSDPAPPLDLSPRPRSSTTSSVPSVPSPLDSLDHLHPHSSNPASASSPAQFPSVSLRPRADSYNHPASWKPWSSGRGLSGPLDYLPSREPAVDRKSWLQLPSSATTAPNDAPLAVIPRSLSLHDLHGTPDSHLQRHPQSLGGFGSANQPSGPLRPGYHGSVAPSLYSEPTQHPRLSFDAAASYHFNDTRSASFPEPASAPALCDGPFAAVPASAPRAGNRGEAVADEISTIFVVGFPDDMNEREFQNMFMFSNGFEAATLKVPASTLAARERDITAAVVAAAAAAAGNGAVRPGGAVGFGPGPNSHRLAGIQQPNGLVVDQFGMPLLGMDGFDDGFYQGALGLESQFVNARQHSLGLGGPMVSNCLGPPSLHGVMDLQGGGGGGLAPGNRKQIIGFAKFKTRVDALQARDVLSGRKVDADKGHVLKAEMAKKNLHTKRGLSNEAAPGPSGPNGAVQAVNHMPSQPLVDVGGTPFGPLPPRHEPGAGKRVPFGREHVKPDPSCVVSGSGELTRCAGPVELGFDSWNSFNSSVGALHEHNASRRRYTLAAPETALMPFAGLHSETAGEDGLGHHGDPDWDRTQSPMIEASLGKSLWEKLEGDSDGGADRTLSIDVISCEAKSARASEGSGASGGAAGDSAGSSSASPAPANSRPSVASSTAVSGSTAWTGPSPRNCYPADQNPAINTLYVGGLPAVMENVGDIGVGPNMMMMTGMMMMRSEDLESSLRQVFGRAEGFKRLSYKVKNQQPMCFVEFETVEQASIVMDKMYGDQIEGKVPGGIRLAYSRNALGVRSTGSSCSSANSTPSVLGSLTS